MTPTITTSDARRIEDEERDISRRKYQEIHNVGTVVPGMGDDRLFSMLRRFKIQIQHVRAPAHPVPIGELDLRQATPKQDAPFNVDLIRSNAERLAMSLGVDLLLFLKEMDRLSSWNDEDRYRTKIAATAYAVTWLFGLVIPATLALVAVLMFFSSAREVLFPRETSFDPSTSKSEQIEEATHDFFDGVMEFVRRVILGQAGIIGGGGSGDNKPQEEAEYKDQHRGREAKQQALKKGATRDQATKSDEQAAQKERDELIERSGRSLQDGLGYLADLCEASANALSDPAMYPKSSGRRNLASTTLVLAFLFAVTPTSFVQRGISAGIGLAFFGRPLIVKGWKHFVYHVPNWKELIDPRSSILSQVPDNQQLVLHILRQSESARAPLPLPPTLQQEEEEEERFINQTAGERLPFDPSELHRIEAERQQRQVTPSSRSRMSAFLLQRHRSNKETAKHGFRDLVGLQPKVEEPKLKYAIKSKLTHFIEETLALDDDGRVEAYPTELDDVRGHLFIDLPDKNRPPSSAKLLFIPDTQDGPIVTIGVGDIVELTKGEVESSKMKAARTAFEHVAGHGPGLETLHIRECKQRQGIGKQVAENVWVTNVDFGDDEDERCQEWIFKRVGRRDQLFMRLLALPGVKWEVW